MPRLMRAIGARRAAINVWSSRRYVARKHLRAAATYPDECCSEGHNDERCEDNVLNQHGPAQPLTLRREIPSELKGLVGRHV